MSQSDFQHNKEIILRDYLALERTRLANERTLFSYIRTALYLTLGGIAFMEMEDFKSIKWLAPICFILSVVILLTGIIKYFLMKRRLKKFYATSHSLKTHIEP
ncbi:MAG: DUF202 domain-containing protein [Dysgonamonadaceae bacterium]|jgi:putative membrane protein|nr:DUF202 domain-containing protein [Dysgonamonadaceae bacterium]MDD3727518.1 DUF202 domain-containing protein [Dysgonamonadaceae bacterium]HUI33789.1 DUF202 domain-containing protein [Dysgonamonadaceae bacterium]